MIDTTSIVHPRSYVEHFADHQSAVISMKVAGQHGAVLATVFVVVAAFFLPAAAESISSVIIYADNQCSGTPLVVSMIGSVTCESEACSSFTATDGTTYYSSTNCVNANRETYVDDAFRGSSYLLLEMFTVKCGLFVSASGYLATGQCQIYSITGGNSVVAKMNEDGSANLSVYSGTSCSGTPILSYAPDSDTVSSHSCYKNYSVFYTSTASGADGSASLSTAGSSVATSTAPIVTNAPSTVSSIPATNINSTSSNSGDNKVSSTAGSFISVDSSDAGVVGKQANGSRDESGSQSGSKFTESIAPPGDSGGISTGAIVGILVAYVVLCIAACILCMDKMERIGRRLCSRR